MVVSFYLGLPCRKRIAVRLRLIMNCVLDSSKTKLANDALDLNRPTAGTPLMEVWQQTWSAMAIMSAVAMLALCLICLPAGAQSTFGSIRGTAADATAAAIPEAQVTLHSKDENTDRLTTTDGSGTFAFENVKAGNYTIIMNHAGFSTTNLNGVTVTARQDLRVNVALAIASDATSIDVTSSEDQINTENAAISDVKDNLMITQLPLNNRATTTSPLGSLGLSANVQQDSSGNIALGGATSSMVNFSVDGISTANVRQNGALQDAYPSQEGIADVKITAFNNSAEFSQVGDVTFTTKSGTNQFHGSVFEYFQNDALDANPYGFTSKAPKHFNTFGGSLGGPVVLPFLYNGRGKTFFFADYEGNRRSTATLQQFLVPTAADRAGNLGDICGGTVNNISATAKAVLSYYPLPNLQTPLSCGSSVSYNYENFQKIPARTDGADARVDQSFGAKHAVYARFSRKNISSSVANAFLPDDVNDIHNRSLLVSYTYTITPHILNEFRYGFTNVSTSVNFPIQGSTALAQFNLRGVDISQHPLTNAFPTFNFTSGTGFTQIGRDKAGISQSKTTQFSDNVSYSAGRHNLKAGIDIRHVRYFDLESFAPAFASDDFGSFTFQPTFSNNAFGDFLQGKPTSLNFAVSSPDVGGTANQYSFFLQDEWQISSKLSLSYGLRYQLLPGFIEDGGNLANYDQATNSIVVPDNLAGYLKDQKLTTSNVAFQQSFNACNLQQPGACTKYVTASQDGLPQSLRATYKGNIQPRLAFAYRPFNDTKNVVRGGFGIYTMTNLGPLSFNNSGNPTSNLHSYTNCTPGSTGCTGTPIVFPNTAPPASGPTYGGGSLDQAVDPHFRDPQSNQWSITVERQVSTNNSLRASYVGMHTYRLSITEDLNQLAASKTAFDATKLPYQNWNELYSTFNHGKANYKALELEATHRMARGLYYDASYTLAKNESDNQGDNPSSFTGEVAYGFPVADRFHIGNSYGNVIGTRRRRLLVSGVYQLPFGDGRAYLSSPGIKNRLLGGWDLNTVVLLETGPWLTPSISPSFDASNTNVQARGAFLRPDVVSRDFYKGQSRAQYFNLAAFAPTPANAGRFGNAGVGILQGPGTKTVSLGLAKQFKVTEGTHIRFESTFTNVLNHTNFAPPATQIDNTATFGVLSASQTAENAGNRTGQLALRFEF